MTRRPIRPLSWLLAVGAALTLAAGPARAGGGPQNVLVVVNDQSTASLDLGSYYRERRGIPERNVCHLSVNPNQPDISAAQAQSRILEPIRAHLREHGLDDQIRYIVLCGDFPTRVNDHESITAVLYYGFKDAPRINPPAVPCGAPENTRNLYHYAERSFQRIDSSGGLGCLAMWLSAYDPGQARALVDRAVAADGARPPGTFYLMKPPGDPNRNIRYLLFDNFKHAADGWPGFPKYEILNENSRVGLTDILGYLDGLPNHSEAFWTGNVYRAGAIADHFTSYGGRLPEPPMGQASLLEWIRAGATASYGTVSEPCAILSKFPDPMLYFWYARGFNLAESYWMSVAHPYQGLFAGEPLAAPYATPPEVHLAGPATAGDVSGIVTIRVEAAAAPRQLCRQVDLFVDDVLTATLTNVGPTAWNTLDLQIGSDVYRYVVSRGDTLYDAVEGLGRVVNRKSQFVRATVAGDRLMLVDTRVDTREPVAIRINTSEGLAGELTIFGEVLAPRLSPAPVAARKIFGLKGVAGAGDRVAVEVRRPDRDPVALEWRPEPGLTAELMLQQMAEAVNRHPDLGPPVGVYLDDVRNAGDMATGAWVARSDGPAGLAIEVSFAVESEMDGAGFDPKSSFTARLSDNINLLANRSALLFRAGRIRLECAHLLDTTRLADGAHTLRVVAYDGTAVETQGHAVRTIEVRNTALRCGLDADPGPDIPWGQPLKLTARPEPTAGVQRVTFWVEGKPYATKEKPPYQVEVDTQTLGVGPVSVRALVQDRQEQAAFSPVTRITIVPGR
jgi:uncharacterized protein (TIGR03790 family)